MITLEQFSLIFPKAKNPQIWIDNLNKLLPQYEINTKNRIASFLAQTGHESAGYTILTENLNYSAITLNKIFPKYFIRAGRDANQYHRKPEKIANVIYANRMGNGDTASGDGWKFRGRGLIQLTGKSNYTEFSRWINESSILDNPDLISQDYGYAIMSAIWYWSKHNLNIYSDKEDLKSMTKIINGGYIGLDDRINLYNKIKRII